MAGEEGVTAPLVGSHESLLSLKKGFSTSASVLLVVLVVLFAVLVEYPAYGATDLAVGQYYWWYIHVAIMIYVGFGFLMTFLRSYSYSAVGLNFLTSSYVILAAVICVGVAKQEIWSGSGKRKIAMDLPLLIDSNFCAGAAMISFGALLGKVTPTQILWILVLETPIYAINAKLADRLGALDIGGSITIHAFGAFYGLAASKVLSKPGSGSDHHKNAAVRTSDMTAMIGTLFLWIFWPSFNGALASNPGNPDSPAQFYCVINTVVALLGATCAAFATSAGVLGKFDMVHIQNATLAGGVAVGSAANLSIAPAGALAIGIGSGCLSTLGYAYSQPYFEKTIGLRDTCGVINLHAGPGIIGGIAAALAALAKSNKHYLVRSSPGSQFLFQIIALVVTLAISMAAGAIIALVVRSAKQSGSEGLKVENMYEDSVFWEEGFAEEQAGILNSEGAA